MKAGASGRQGRLEAHVVAAVDDVAERLEGGRVADHGVIAIGRRAGDFQRLRATVVL